MKPDEFEKLCRSYLPNCVIKYKGTCGLCCYNGGDDIFSIKVSLLEDGRFGVYDQWRDITITKDLNYVKKFLQKVSDAEVRAMRLNRAMRLRLKGKNDKGRV